MPCGKEVGGMSEKSDRKAVKRDEKGKFVAGGAPVSPGRPKKPPELKDAADQSLATLIKLRDTTDSEKLKAEICRWLYEMQYGKAKQATEIEGNVNTGAIRVELEGDIDEWAK